MKPASGLGVAAFATPSAQSCFSLPRRAGAWLCAVVAAARRWARRRPSILRRAPSPRHAPSPPRAARSWPGTQVGGDGNGFGSIVADPRRPRTMYAASLDAGLFKSADAGRTWRMLPFPRGGQGDRVDALAITPTGPRVLYVGGSAGVFASDDGGRTWQAANNGLVPDRCGEGAIRRHEGWIFSLTVHPLDPDLMYAGGATSSWRSTDGGDHWTRFQVGRLDIAIDPQDTRVLYAPNQQWRYRDQRLVATPVLPTEDSVVKSTDGGRTLESLGSPASRRCTSTGSWSTPVTHASCSRRRQTIGASRRCTAVQTAARAGGRQA